MSPWFTPQVRDRVARHLHAKHRPVQPKPLPRHVIILVRKCTCLWHRRRHVIILVRKCTCLWPRRRWHKQAVTLVRFLITGPPAAAANYILAVEAMASLWAVMRRVTIANFELCFLQREIHKTCLLGHSSSEFPYERVTGSYEIQNRCSFCLFEEKVTSKINIRACRGAGAGELTYPLVCTKYVGVDRHSHCGQTGSGVCNVASGRTRHHGVVTV